MSREDEINKLKSHIHELSAEILRLKKMINPYMSTKEYVSVHARFLSVNNLKVLAENELEATLHQYKVVLSGKSTSVKDQNPDKVMRGKFRSEINCKLFVSKNLDVSIKSHDQMYKYITNQYSTFFQEGKFKIKSIIQLT